MVEYRIMQPTLLKDAGFGYHTEFRDGRPEGPVSLAIKIDDRQLARC